eukprot:TRINITY_DN27959_c0_g1_i1.p1 TRINITY_DN27959_c0_g1~~TRINITY_DN27959_c0_g1_i1.p1  ORF type:complete len:367 (-),score=55.94 TRINITY_DN27959_c0_g1_i1:168-1268(-)
MASSLFERRKVEGGGLSLDVRKHVPGRTSRTMMSERKTIKSMTEQEFSQLYVLGDHVCESVHEGMQIASGKRKSDELEVVIKVLDKRKSFGVATEEREWLSTTEVQLNMPVTDNICQYLDVIATDSTYYVVMEKVEGQDLSEQINHARMSHADAREIVFQIVQALQTLHNEGRIHKDLKLENVMVDMRAGKEPCSPGSAHAVSEHSPTSPGVKLIDFDTVADWEPSSPKAKDVLGSDGYIAPEAYSGQYSPASDMFCVGVIMYKLLTRKFPFRPAIFDDEPGENIAGSSAMRRVAEKMKSEKVNFNRSPLNHSPEAADLCSKLLAMDPCHRPSAEEALQHQWFQLPPENLPDCSFLRRDSQAESQK